MAATIDIACPKCKKEIKAPAELRGKKIRCKACNEIFTVPAAPAGRPVAGKKPAPAAAMPARPPTAPAAAPSKPSDDDDEIEGYAVADPDKAFAALPTSSKTDNTPRPRVSHPDDEIAKNPYGITDLEIAARCPQCAKEMETQESVICLNCGYNTLTREMGKTVRSFAHTPGERIKWLMPGILCAILCMMMLSVIAFLWLLMHRLAEKDPQAWWTFFDALPTQIWGSIIAAGIAWISLKIAINRLIKNPVPPEKIKLK